MESDPVYIRTVVIATILMNLFDLLMTVTLVSHGIANEANPLMRALLEEGGVPVFAVAKMSLVTGGVTYLWSIRERLFARLGLIASMLCYAYVTSIHLSIVAELGINLGLN